MFKKYNILLIFILYYDFLLICVNARSSGWICFEPVRKVVDIPLSDGSIRTKAVYESRCSCMSGYIQRNDECVPQCDPPCENGDCIEPNKCQCFDYYIGSSCETKQCPAGYQGTDCEDSCSANYYGHNCQNQCACKHGNCDSITGECDCHNGWIGSQCDKECVCYNNATCNIHTGECQCKDGSFGEHCENICDEDSWGGGCKNRCDCGEYRCNPINGECISSECKAGRTGENCEEICQEGFWGRNCKKVCRCAGYGCNPVNGECSTECKSGFFGDDCAECPCNKFGTKECLRDSGRCVCEKDWMGDSCGICQSTKFGEHCNQTCVCEEGHYDGCDQISGKCDCKHGWHGNTCSECTCVNGNCDSLTGECNCKLGWRGTKCEEQCPAGWYGSKCNNTCDCFKCRFTDGYCFDVLTQKYCPLELYNITSYQCVPTTGNIRTINQPMLSLDENHTVTIIIVAAGAVLGLITLILIISVIVYRKRNSGKKRNAINSEERNRAYTYSTNEPTPSPIEMLRFPQTSPVVDDTTHIYAEIPNGDFVDNYNNLQHIPIDSGYLDPRIYRPRISSSSLSSNSGTKKLYDPTDIDDQSSIDDNELYRSNNPLLGAHVNKDVEQMLMQAQQTAQLHPTSDNFYGKNAYRSIAQNDTALRPQRKVLPPPILYMPLGKSHQS